MNAAAVDQPDDDAIAVQCKIAGLSALKGLVLYGATLTFAGLYAYFMIKIFGAPSGEPPEFNATEVGVAAALAGVLGSAFALEIGTPTEEHETNPALRKVLARCTANSPAKHKAYARLRKALSLEPSDTTKPSWPKTFGIWVYAAVAASLAFTYIVNQPETPDKISVLAVGFAGYVLALINNAYGLTSRGQ
jgi:hypothetical protein